MFRVINAYNYFMIDKRLRVLQLVAHHGTVTAAAQALNYTAPGVSHQLKQLSAELGVTLLVPEGRGVRLTEEAKILLAHAEVLFAQTERAYADLAAETTSGDFTLCGFSTAASLLPPVATELQNKYPQLTVKLVQASPDYCMNLLLTEEAGVALLPATDALPPLADHRFDQRRLIEDPLDLLVPTDHHLAHSESVELADAAGESWIAGHPDGPYYPLMMSACLAAGFSPKIAHVIEEWEVTHAVVEQGGGVTLIPRMVRIRDRWAVSRVPLEGRAAPRRQIISLARRGSRNQSLIASALEIIEANVALGVADL